MYDPLPSNLAEAGKLMSWLGEQATRDVVRQMVRDMVQCLRGGGRILSCGNGGSMCDAMHFAEELTGRFHDDRPPIAAQAISDPGHLSCVANDYGYEQVFARAVEAFGREGDVLLAFTTSGNSANVVAAATQARKAKMLVCGMLGGDGGGVRGLCDHALVVPSTSTDRIQEIHIQVVHALIEQIEGALHPPVETA